MSKQEDQLYAIIAWLKVIAEALTQIANSSGKTSNSHEKNSDAVKKGSNKVLDNIINEIPFYVKGMKKAPDDADFKFTFIHDRDGNIYEYVEELYKALQNENSLRIGDYEYKIGGRDNNLISGKRVDGAKK